MSHLEADIPEFRHLKDNPLESMSLSFWVCVHVCAVTLSRVVVDRAVQCTWEEVIISGLWGSHLSQLYEGKTIHVLSI